jgi:integrase
MNPKISLIEIFSRFLADEAIHLKPSTLRSYAWYSARFGSFLIGLDVKALRTVDLQDAMEQIAIANPKLTHATLTRIKSLLCSIFSYTVRKGIRDDNPAKAIRVPKGTRGKATSAVSLSELRQTLGVLSGDALVAVAIAGLAGLRAGEIAGLRWADYDSTKSELVVRRSRWRTHETEPKTRLSEATVPVVPELKRILDERLLSQMVRCSPRIVAVNLSNLVERRIKPVLAAIGLPWRGWHSYRRGLASSLHSLGVQDKVIQRILRHSSVAVTQRCYIKTDDNAMREAMNKL